jgi:hypothetical protein
VETTAAVWAWCLSRSGRSSCGQRDGSRLLQQLNRHAAAVGTKADGKALQAAHREAQEGQAVARADLHARCQVLHLRSRVAGSSGSAGCHEVRIRSRQAGAARLLRRHGVLR